MTMNKDSIKKLLQDVHDGKIDVDQAMHELKGLPYEDLGFAKIDTHRDIRKGFPEVIFCQGKTNEQIIHIISRFAESEQTVMATRAEREVYEAIKKVRNDAAYHAGAKIVLIGSMPDQKTEKRVAVVSAGTSDIPVAEEAAVTAEVMGNPVERLYDVGVAGVHRLMDNKEKRALDILSISEGEASELIEMAQNYRRNFIEMVKEKEMNENTKVKNDG